MEITAIPFNYQTDVISKKLFDLHITLYHGYVDKTNEISKKLAASTKAELDAANTTYSVYRGLKRGESFALDGVNLHELYFQNLGSAKETRGMKTDEVFDNFWGGYEAWRDSFVASAKSARGWCVLVYEQRTKSCRNIVLDSHDDGLVCGAYPLLVLDMYEHAYMPDYGTDKASYIGKFIDNVSWEVVERRIGAVVR